MPVYAAGTSNRISNSESLLVVNRARSGSFAYMLALARRFKDMPISLHDEAYAVACEHVEKNTPPTGVYVHRALALGENISCSFILMRNLFVSFSESTPNVDRFVGLWQRASAWAQYLRSVVDHFRIHGMSNDQKDTCVLFAEGISSFLKVSNMKGCLHGEDMLNSFAEFWAMKSELQEVVGNAADALRFLISSVDIDDPALDALLDRLQTTFNTSRDVASHAMNNARMAHSSTDRTHYTVLLSLIILRPRHTISRAVLKAGAIPLALDTMSRILSEITLNNNQCTLLEICIRIVSSGYERPHDGRTWIRQGFEHGQLKILFKLVKRLEVLDQCYSDVICDIFTKSIIPYLHLSSIRKQARRDMISFSEELSHAPFNIQELPANSRGIWTEFETCLMEHAILRCTRVLGYKNEDVYCGNIACLTKMPQHEFSRCAACKLAIYCSRACQRNAWKSGHRAECIEILNYQVPRSAITKRDRSYLLHWVLSQLTPLIPDLRRLALEQFPVIPFEKIGLYVELNCWPMRVLLHPLQPGIYTQESPEIGSPHTMHFRNLAIRRVDDGDLSATMLTILFNTKRGQRLKYVIVDLDKRPLETPRRSTHSMRTSVVDVNRNPIVATRDYIDEVMEGLNRMARLKGKSIWSPGLLRAQVQAAMILL